jgi:hypothetical protein
MSELDNNNKQTMGRQTMGKQTMGRQTIGNETIGKQTIGNETIGNETMGNETMGNQSSSKQSASKQNIDRISSSTLRNSTLRNSTLRNSRMQSFTKKYTQRRAARTIKKFMKTTENTRRSKFLQIICSDSGVCIAFGKERKKIFDFFNGFTKFDFLTNVRSIGSESSNGFIKELEYEREKYKAYAILKSSRDKNADNLLYEYVVGELINKYFINRFPCFIETYGHYKYVGDRENFRTAAPGKIDLRQILIPYDENFIPIDESCRSSIDMCILIQHIKGASSLADKAYDRYVNPKKDDAFIQNDLLSSLFQIYYPLSMLKNNFTHYDLHGDNVIMYKPVEGKYIQYHYHYPDGTKVSFKSQYISKIIDYGRSFFNMNPVEHYPGIMDSLGYYNAVCTNPDCNHIPEICGNGSGYLWMSPPSKKNSYISSSTRNISHDLRLLKELRDETDPLKFTDLRKKILSLVIYKDRYGTPEIVKSDKGRILNVTDVTSALRTLMTKKEYIIANEKYYSKMKKIGDLNIYPYRSMTYTPAS